MIFVRSQALDNASDDMCVLDGQLLNTTAPDAVNAIRLLSKTRQQGRAATEGLTEITTGALAIAVKVDTGDVDQAGRKAPVMAVFDRAELHDLASVVDHIAGYTEMLDRRIDPVALRADLGRWHDSGKAKGGRLSRLRRRTFLALRRARRNLFGRLSLRDGAP